MRMFRRDASGSLVARFESEEAEVLRQLAFELLQLFDGVDRAEAPATDPALLRLLPDAYRDDAEAAAEFRRFTAEDLVRRKMDNARAVVAALDSAEPEPIKRRAFSSLGEVTVRLDAAGALAWLRALADMRLALGVRLGIDDDGAEADWAGRDAKMEGVRNVFDWLAAVQDGLVNALDR
ncbi:DUF2017 domain-containing protein [Microbacteriaceae bacterium VKM Ac-2855]|nr:DUF2017 domain-containing protein [Microbacteriaceae bacterium VKM Ac-2855]